MQGGIHRGLADLGGQYLAYPGGQRQGEVAVAAVQLKQVVLALAQGLIRPVEHLLVDRAVGLGEGAFRLAVAEGAPGNLQLFDGVIATDHYALALGATDDAHAQVAGQLLRGGFPVLVQRAVVAQGDHCIACQGGEELHLEQLEAQRRTGLPGGLEPWHQVVDLLAGNREVFDQDRRVLLARGEHCVEALLVFAPQAKLGAQAIVLARRVEHRRFGSRERRQQLAQARDLGVELLGVGRRIEDSTHALNQPSLMTNRIERITSAALRSRARPESSLIAVQAMKPKAMPLAIE